MELDRKEFHFDLDVDSLKRTYSDHDSSSWNAAWSDIRELLEERYGAIRFQDLFRIMSDHKNGVNGICRHPEEGYPGWTMSTSLFVLEDREVWTTLDNPCKNLRYSLLK